jgi:hypothetical protein
MATKIELLNQWPPKEVIEKTYLLQDEEGVLVYKEWADKETGTVIDSLLRSKEGYEVLSYETFTTVQQFIEKLKEQSNQTV